MHVQVDQDLCVSCGTCLDLCPDVFSWNEDEKAQATEEEIPKELENDAHEAVENCPASTISEL